jgi:hypothetical protein
MISIEMQFYNNNDKFIQFQVSTYTRFYYLFSEVIISVVSEFDTYLNSQKFQVTE